MSRLDDIEQRLAALEAGGDLAQRLAAIEKELGFMGLALGPSVPAGTRHCGRCGMDQPADFRCAQDKCPLK